MTEHPHDAPTAVVDRYTEELYHRRNLDALDELVAEPMIRHEPGGRRVALSRKETRERIASFHQEFRSMRFSNRLLVDDGRYVAAAYEADLVDHDGDIHTISGIEIFLVENGRIAEVWNPPAGDGSWG